MQTEEKYKKLLGDLRQMGKAVLAFSGGVDSTLLLHAAKEALGDNLLAVTLVAPYISATEVAEAEEMTHAMKVRHRVIVVPFPEEIRDNPPDHCYHCKRKLFTTIAELAATEQIGHILEGTNTDDLQDYRPGLRALKELGIKSPLLEAGLTKDDIRSLSHAFRLPTWDKPAKACLLSRIPVGTRVEEQELRRIEEGETFLAGLGFPAVRLRSHGSIARIEVPSEQVAALVEAAQQSDIDGRLKELGYRYVTLDLGGYRRGNLNENDA